LKKHFFRRLYSRGSDTFSIILEVLGFGRSDRKLIQDAQRYWEKPKDFNRWKGVSHIRSGQGFARDESKWLALGKEHFRLYEMFSRALQFPRPLTRIVEWGCGGGANAIHFATECKEFVGVDVSDSTLKECEQQVESVGKAKFVPVRVTIDEPEQAVLRIPQKCELFLCTYVFELIPSAEYGKRILRIATNLLTDGGMALIQIKYAESFLTRSRGFNYERNSANMTTYRIEAFWHHAKEAGLTPMIIHLVPEQPLVHDVRYAYFCLIKSESGGITL
jgi:hypothetical protein